MRTRKTPVAGTPRRRRRRAPAAYVMGVDPSLNRTGICLPSGNTLVLPSLGTKGWERLSIVMARLIELLDEHRVTHIALEGYAFGRNRQQGTFDTAEFVGVMKLLFLSRGLGIVIVPPKTLKKYVTDNGNAQKGEVMAAIKKRWGRSFTDNDMADAYALHEFGKDYIAAGNRRNELLSKARQELPTETLQAFANIG